GVAGGEGRPPPGSRGGDGLRRRAEAARAAGGGACRPKSGRGGDACGRLSASASGTSLARANPWSESAMRKRQRSRFTQVVLNHLLQVKASLFLAALCVLGLILTGLLAPWPVKIVFDYV